jgi:hypothetical protein
LSGKLDLSGEWTGIYNYPIALPPVAFEAAIQESAGRISGTTSELSSFGPQRRLDAVIDGTRDGQAVAFIKMYEDTQGQYDVVHYSGTLDPEGDEIGGHWTVSGMSGTFLMIRRSRTTESVSLEAEEKIDD